MFIVWLLLSGYIRYFTYVHGVGTVRVGTYDILVMFMVWLLLSGQIRYFSHVHGVLTS